MKSSISSKALPAIQERDALRALNAVAGFGNRRISRLIEHLGSAAAAFSAPCDEVSRIAGIPLAATLNLKHFPVDEFLESDNRALAANKARVVTLQDKEYPPQLLTIPDAPVVIYVVGELPAPEDVCVAIVGSRRPTLYGLEVAERFAISLAERGVIVISGLAKGIDGAVHRGALKAKGRTLGILGCGLDIIYPPDNVELYNELRGPKDHNGGCGIVSEFPFGTLPAPFNFPRRNRIVSGMSLGVLVVEANIKSGALITASFAAEQGREVFAVPGRVDSPLSTGPHALIRQGAKLTISVEDILEELPVQVGNVPEKAPGISRTTEEPDGMDPDEKLVWSLIKEGQMNIEELEERTGRPPAMLMGPLLSLQIKRMVRELPGKSYVPNQKGCWEKGPS